MPTSKEINKAVIKQQVAVSELDTNKDNDHTHSGTGDKSVRTLVPRWLTADPWNTNHTGAAVMGCRATFVILLFCAVAKCAKSLLCVI